MAKTLRFPETKHHSSARHHEWTTAPGMVLIIFFGPLALGLVGIALYFASYR